jgi:hypothetical protein
MAVCIYLMQRPGNTLFEKKSKFIQKNYTDVDAHVAMRGKTLHCAACESCAAMHYTT